jgi:flagellar secretion chaperone FliS
MDAYSHYRTQAASTASPAQLVLMLYDGALAQVSRAEVALTDRPDPGAANDALTRAQAIVTHLHVTLDRERGGEVAANLAGLYTYCNERLVAANVAKSPDGLADVTSVLSGLRDAWDQACCGSMVAVAG